MKTVVKAFIYSIALAGLLISSSNGANAHSGLISSNPSQGEVLDQLPQALTLTFNEELIVIDGETVNSLQLIAEGRANKETAQELHISIKTVEKHRQSLMDKLNIHDTAGLTRHAISTGVIESSVQVTIM
jgi:DNA-binding CsgD family transcriptional regulator